VSFAGKVALITGGGTGIGAACARRLAADGVRIAVLGRRRGPLEEVAKEIGGLAVVCDAAQTAEMRGAVASVAQRFGGLDILISCAGGHGISAAHQTDDDAWAQARRANLDSAFVSAREALPSLLARRGAIVFIASIAALGAGAEVCGYTTFKHALIGLTRSLARDYGPQGLRVNVVCPGWVRTPMADEEMQPLMQRFGISLDEAYERVTADVPLRRAARPEEIAAVCRFLVSDEASILTGAVVVADGGSTIVDVPTLAFER
jgi:meso-butanediol dehydrogenase / (S,S)-butanediol dehydrogenase / diacetyl reductase